MAEIVKYRSVSIAVYPWKHPSGREYWRFKAHDKHVTRSTLKAAKAEALRVAQQTYRGQLDLDELTPEQNAAMKRMIDADPTCKHVDEYLVWLAKRAPKKNVGEAIDEFLNAKEANKGSSPHNIRTLKRHLSALDRSAILSNIALPAIPGSPRTRRNVQAAWVTFFRWCRDRDYLPYGERTVVERMERPIVTRGIPATWEPEELRVLLANVRPAYLPWLAMAAFGGLRTEEVCPDKKSAKSPLAWEDVIFERDLIIVRPETAKTGHRRVIPLCASLRSILEPLRASGNIGPHLPPSCPPCGGKQAETTRLGLVVGGWKRNALRHSFISYRAAQVGLSQTAMEAGNSEAEARRSYNDAKGKDEAEAWFSVVLGKAGEH